MPDLSTPQARLKYFIEQKCNNNMDEFSRQIGRGNGFIKKYVKPDGSWLGGEAIASLGKAGLNPIWYLTGKGDMCLDSQSSVVLIPDITNMSIADFKQKELEMQRAKQELEDALEKINKIEKLFGE